MPVVGADHRDRAAHRVAHVDVVPVWGDGDVARFHADPNLGQLAVGVVPDREEAHRVVVGVRDPEELVVGGDGDGARAGRAEGPGMGGSVKEPLQSLGHCAGAESDLVEEEVRTEEREDHEHDDRGLEAHGSDLRWGGGSLAARGSGDFPAGGRGAATERGRNPGPKKGGQRPPPRRGITPTKSEGRGTWRFGNARIEESIPRPALCSSLRFADRGAGRSSPAERDSRTCEATRTCGTCCCPPARAIHFGALPIKPFP